MFNSKFIINKFKYLEKKIYKSFGFNLFNTNISKNNTILVSKDGLNKGWYLTSFYHNDERNIIGTFNIKGKKFKQKRVYKKGKLRYRLIRLSINSYLEFKINNSLKNFKLNIIRVPSLFAIFIILKNNKKIGISSISKLNISKNWFFYNNYFNYQVKRKSIISYNYYIKIIESKYKKLYGISNLKHYKYFDLQEYSNLKLNNKKWVLPIKEGDKLSNFALKAFSKTIKDNPNCKLLYSDEDFINEIGIRENPKFKTAWNRELFWSDPDFGRCWIIKGDLWNIALKFYKRNKINKPCVTQILYFITQKLEDSNMKNSIIHLPLVCYHRGDFKRNFYIRNGDKSSIQKLNLHLKNNIKNIGKVESVSLIEGINCHKIQWAYPKNSRLSIIIATKDKKDLLEKCLLSIFNLSTKKNHQILIVDNNSKEHKTVNYLNQLNNLKTSFEIKILPFKNEFNFSEINNFASQKVNGDSILLLNNDIEFKSPSWDIELLSNTLRKDIGCVGAKLFFPNNYLQHAGVIIGLSNFAGYSHKNFKKDELGYECRIQLSQEYLALTGACLALSKKNWNKLRGMNSNNLPINYNDIDLCLRSFEMGLKNLYLPFVEAIHHESSTRGKFKEFYYNQWKKELYWMRTRWKNYILNGDYFYNPSLSLLSEDFFIGINNRKRFFNPRKLNSYQNN